MNRFFSSFGVVLTSEVHCFLTVGDTLEIDLIDDTGQPRADSPSAFQRVSLHSVFYNERFDASMPRALKYVVEGSGLDQRQATDGAALVCNRLRSLVALADNSHVAPAYPELVLDTSAGRSDTDFWQYETPPRTRVEPPTRHLQSTLLNDFIATVTAFPAANQLISAFEHYNLALDRIRPGFEVELMMRIYVCAEALAKAAIEESAKRNNNNKSAVRDEFGAPNSGAIEEWIRIEHIFEGDGNLYKALRLARHGYAHGGRFKFR